MPETYLTLINKYVEKRVDIEKKDRSNLPKIQNAIVRRISQLAAEWLKEIQNSVMSHPHALELDSKRVWKTDGHEDSIIAAYMQEKFNITVTPFADNSNPKIESNDIFAVWAFCAWGCPSMPTRYNFSWKPDNQEVYANNLQIAIFKPWIHLEGAWQNACKGIDTDYTFHVENEIIHVHKHYLITHSPVFRAKFASQMKDANAQEAKVTNASSSHFKSFLQFLYMGDLPVLSLKDYINILDLANEYQVSTLKECCKSKILASTKGIVDADNFHDILHCGILTQSPDLIAACARWAEKGKEEGVKDFLSHVHDENSAFVVAALERIPLPKIKDELLAGFRVLLLESKKTQVYIRGST